jgi:hypothetical protein
LWYINLSNEWTVTFQYYDIMKKKSSREHLKQRQTIP